MFPCSIAQKCERFLAVRRKKTRFSTPIKIKMAPPSTEALPARCVPKRRPITSPAVQITKVTAAMMPAHASAISGPYSAMVKPTDSASMEVATPCKTSPPPLTASLSSPGA